MTEVTWCVCGHTHTQIFSKHFIVFERNNIAVILQSLNFQLSLVSLTNHEWNKMSCYLFSPLLDISPGFPSADSVSFHWRPSLGWESGFWGWSSSINELGCINFWFSFILQREQKNQKLLKRVDSWSIFQPYFSKTKSCSSRVTLISMAFWSLQVPRCGLAAASIAAGLWGSYEPCEGKLSEFFFFCLFAEVDLPFRVYNNFLS